MRESVPAICDNCGREFDAPVEVGRLTVIETRDWKFGPCPHCGGEGSPPAGLYVFAEEVPGIVAGWSRTQLRQMKDQLERAYLGHDRAAAIVALQADSDMRNLANGLDQIPDRAKFWPVVELIVRDIEHRLKTKPPPPAPRKAAKQKAASKRSKRPPDPREANGGGPMRPGPGYLFVPTPAVEINCDVGESVPIEVVPKSMATAIAPVSIRKNGSEPKLYGTAFAIAHFATGYSIYVTAKHVLDKIFPLEKGDDMVVLLPTDGASALVGARVRNLAATEAGKTDVALLAVDRRTAARPIFPDLRRMPITFRKPETGERCMMLGFPGSESSAFDGETSRVDLKPKASAGLVEEVHPERRDRSFVTYPSFAIKAFYEAGMSGGPVLGVNGHVLGVVSTGYEVDEGVDPIAYGALLAGILELEVEMEEADGTMRKWPVTELADIGAFLKADEGSVLVDRTEDGLRIEWGDHEELEKEAERIRRERAADQSGG